jgi:hypothetical protein
MPKNNNPALISGLYSDSKKGLSKIPLKTIREINESLVINQNYRNDIIVLAGDDACSEILSKIGLIPKKNFRDAPEFIKNNSVHLMKHWMCIWALREYDEFIWIDWDTIQIKTLDKFFFDYCRKYNTPKFIYIKKYWAKVNCGVYYSNINWLEKMELGLSSLDSETNDELCWSKVLPNNLDLDHRYWWGDLIINIWDKNDLNKITKNTYFIHVKDFSLYSDVKKYILNPAK